MEDLKTIAIMKECGYPKAYLELLLKEYIRLFRKIIDKGEKAWRQ